jgi:hypothetical protein
VITPERFQRVADALAAGETLHGAARRLKTSLGTVRTIHRGQHWMQRGRRKQGPRQGKPLGDCFKPEYIPPPELVELRAAAIAASWSDEERERRWHIAHSIGWTVSAEALARVA